MSTTPRPLRSPWLGEGLTSATRDESGRKSGANMTIYGFAGRDLSGRRGSRQTVMCRNDDAIQARELALLQALTPNHPYCCTLAALVAARAAGAVLDMSGLVGQKKRRPGRLLPAGPTASRGTGCVPLTHQFPLQLR